MKNKGFSETRQTTHSVRRKKPVVASARGVRKRPVNISISEDLLEAAKERGVNLSQTLEHALSDKLKRVESERWLAENQEAIDYYNRYVEKHGVFSQGRRRF